MTNYLKAMKKNQELQAKLKEEIMAPKERKDSAAHDEQILKNARALRRSMYIRGISTQIFYIYGPSCSKLTTSLVNDSLKF